MMQTRRTVEKTTTSKRHKRTASAASFDPAEEVEEQKDEQVDADTAPQKRRKKGGRKSTTSKTTTTNTPTGSQPAVVIEHHHSSHTIQLSDAEAAATNNELQITPLSARFGIDGRTRRRLSRSHLSEEMNHIEEHKREDVRKDHELEELRHKIEEKDQVIDDLTEQVEIQRQNAIDLGSDEPIEVQRLAAELEQHKRERMLLSSAHDDQGEVTYPTLPDDESDDGSDIEMTQPLTASGRQEAVIAELENKVRTKSQEVAEVKAVVELLQTELDALGFAPKGDPLTVLSSVRTAFETARLTTGAILQDDFEHLSNQEFLEMLSNRCGFLKGHLDITKMQHRQVTESYDKLFEKHTTVVQDYDNMLTEVETLEETIIGEKQGNTEVRKELAEAKEDLTAAHKEVDNRDEQIAAQSQDIEEITAELNDVIIAKDRLKKAMDSYMDERRDMERIIEKMQVDQASLIERLNSEQAAAMAEVRGQLDDVANKLATIEDLADDRMREITEKDVALELSERKRDVLKAEKEKLTDDLNAERDAHAATADALQTLEDAKADVEDALLAAEEEVTALKESIAQLKENVEALHAQIENLTVDNETYITKIGQMDAKMHELGLEANKLRDKLFQGQVNHGKEVEALKTEHAAVEEQFQADFDAESQRREEAELEVQEHKTTITKLTKQITLQTSNYETLQQQMEELEAAKELQIDTLNKELDQMEDTHQKVVQRKDAEIDELDSRISGLAALVTAQEQDIARLQLQLRKATEEHDLAVEQLQEQVGNLQGTVEEKTKALTAGENVIQELEEKLEEAEQSRMDDRDEYEQELSEQKTVVANQAAVIAELTREKEVTVTEHTETVTEMTRKDEALQAHNERQEAYIGRLEADVARLQEQLEHIKQIHREGVEDDVDSQRKVEDLLLEAVSKVQGEHADKRRREEQRLAEIESFATANLESEQLMTPGPSQVHTQSGAEEVVDKVTVKTKKTKAKKVKKSSAFRDSGFGAEEMDIE